MHHRTLAVSTLFLVATTSFVPVHAQTETATAQLQSIVDNYVAQRAPIEGFTGLALHVSFGDAQPSINVFAGNNGLPDPQPMTSSNLFAIGSNTKSFTSALLLMLEASGKLSIDQTVGDWLPEYPAWASVTIRSLLDMTSRIPSYDATPAMGMLQVNLSYQFTPQQLIAFVDSDQGSTIPPTPVGYSYSNTNYFLAALIIERASGLSYKQALEQWIIKPFHLRNTYYNYGPPPQYVLDRMTAGIYNDPTCLEYQPDYGQAGCVSVLAPLLGKDVHTENLSWAGPAGGIIATLGDVAKWYRALFGGRVVPQAQLEEMKSVVSTATGIPIPSTTPSDPVGYGLALTQVDIPSVFGTRIWYYSGETLDGRVVFAYWPTYDLVITTTVNSNVSDDVGKTFPLTVLGSAFTTLLQSGLIHALAEPD